MPFTYVKKILTELKNLNGDHIADWEVEGAEAEIASTAELDNAIRHIGARAYAAMKVSKDNAKSQSEYIRHLGELDRAEARALGRAIKILVDIKKHHCEE